MITVDAASTLTSLEYVVFKQETCCTITAAALADYYEEEGDLLKARCWRLIANGEIWWQRDERAAFRGGGAGMDLFITKSILRGYMPADAYDLSVISKDDWENIYDSTQTKEYIRRISSYKNVVRVSGRDVKATMEYLAEILTETAAAS